MISILTKGCDETRTCTCHKCGSTMSYKQSDLMPIQNQNAKSFYDVWKQGIYCPVCNSGVPDGQPSLMHTRLFGG